MQLGQDSAKTIFSLIGDATPDQITPEIYAQTTRALADLGAPLDQDDLTFSPQNVANLMQMSKAGKQLNQQGRSSAAKRVFEGDFTFRDEKGNIFSQQTFADPNAQTTRSTLTDVSGRGLSPEGALTPIQTTGETVQEKRTADITAAGDKTTVTEEAKVDVAVGATEKVANSQARIASIKEGAVLDARDLNTLKKTSGARKRNIVKAEAFRDALQSGLRSSGVGRQAALFAPIGVWTDQGSFDEIFNAFAEVAAREQLKASGEVRPTDADVQGMKGAMFGVGRSEEANLQLLNEFIDDQNAMESALAGGGQSPASNANPAGLSPEEQSELEALRKEFNR